MPHITATIATRGRYDSTLPMALSAVLSQTRTPDQILLIDDNPEGQRVDIGKHPVLGQLLSSCAARCETVVVRGLEKGPQHNHEQARIEAKELVWRVDDDETPEPRVLEILEAALIADPKLGAVAGLVPVPPLKTNPHASSAAENICWAANAQWFAWPGLSFVHAGHLHSSYLYRKQAAQYRLDLSPVGHREETFHSMQIAANGWGLGILPAARTWHFRQPTGGIRSHADADAYKRDERLFMTWLKTQPIKWRHFVQVVAGHGLGDKFALLEAMPAIVEYHAKRGRKVRAFVPDGMADLFRHCGTVEPVDVVPYNDLPKYHIPHDAEIYGWMSNAKHTGGIAKAYESYYTGGYEQWLA